MADTRIRNPFKHDHAHDHHGHGHHHHHGDGHDHDHDHHHGDNGQFEPADPAQQSLADALRVSFAVLKVLMVFLFICYLFTGIFRVESDEVAVRLQFGRIVGEPGKQVYGPGWHFGLPYPIEQVITIPQSERTITIDRAFWYQTPPGSEGQTEDQIAMRAGPLNPERDGSLLTGDANVVHGQFSLSYVITPEGAADFVRNIGSVELADRIVRNVAEQGIVYAVAQTEADSVARNQVNGAAALQRMQDALDAMGAGITISQRGLIMTRGVMPLPVRSAYQSVVNAESERARLMEEARQTETRILNETAGEAHEELFRLVMGYELARAANNDEQAEALAEIIDQSLDALQVQLPEGGAVKIGGRAAAIINEAQTQRTQTVEQVKSEANTFRNYLPAYRENPQLTKTLIWQQARAEIFSSPNIETWYASPDSQTLVIDKDPEIRKRREQEAAIQRQQRAQQQGQSQR